ncbi:MAG: septum formation initiator family protein [Actinomycetota bacterium]
MSGPSTTLERPSPSDGDGDGPDGEVSRSRRLVRLLLPVGVTAALVIVLVVAVFPTRQLLDQRAQVGDARDELSELDAELDELTERTETLRDRDAAELMARDEFLLARPSDELYVIRPPEKTAADFPTGWPFPGVEYLVNGG